MKERKALFVSKERHKEFKIRAVQLDVTFDEYLRLLMADK